MTYYWIAAQPCQVPLATLLWKALSKNILNKLDWIVQQQAGSCGVTCLWVMIHGGPMACHHNVRWQRNVTADAPIQSCIPVQENGNTRGGRRPGWAGRLADGTEGWRRQTSSPEDRLEREELTGTTARLAKACTSVWSDQQPHANVEFPPRRHYEHEHAFTAVCLTYLSA